IGSSVCAVVVLVSSAFAVVADADEPLGAPMISSSGASAAAAFLECGFELIFSPAHSISQAPPRRSASFCAAIESDYLAGGGTGADVAGFCWTSVRCSKVVSRQEKATARIVTATHTAIMVYVKWRSYWR